jgi:hypothetical protein
MRTHGYKSSSTPLKTRMTLKNWPTSVTHSSKLLNLVSGAKYEMGVVLYQTHYPMYQQEWMTSPLYSHDLFASEVQSKGCTVLSP